jgi:hypothetical protein
LGWAETFVAPFIAFGLGILAGIVIKHWEIRYSRPVISIISQVIVRGFGLTDESGAVITYFANRVKVTNTGRTGAKDCKAYVDFGENDIERTGWMLPDDNTAYSLTLNVNVIEYVDLCAISVDGLTRVVTLEYGYRKGTVGSCRILPPGNRNLVVRVTSSNAQPAARTVRLCDTIDHFPNQLGRIVEFTS